MVFKYRAAEAPPSSFSSSSSNGYFPPQPPLFGGYGGIGGLRRAERLGSAAAVRAAPMLPREMAGRDLERERIREEVLRRWELEEEVRRELAYEREIALRRHLTLRQEPGRALPPPLPLPLPPPSRDDRGLRIVEIPPEPISIERFPLPRISVADNCVIERAPDLRLGTSASAFVGGSPRVSKLVGTKRKSIIEQAQFTKSKKAEEWSCALCEVTATSEQGLHEHLQGKKHKSKEVELKGYNSAVAKRAAIEQADVTSPQTVQKVWACPLCLVSTTSEQGLKEHFQGKKHRAKEEELNKSEDKDEDDSSPNPKAENSEQQQLQKKEKFAGRRQFYCERCKVKCNSEQMYESHLHGLKHVNRMKKLEKRKVNLVRQSGPKQCGKKAAVVKDGCTETEAAKKIDGVAMAESDQVEAVASESTDQDQVSSTDVAEGVRGSP